MSTSCENCDGFGVEYVGRYRKLITCPECEGRGTDYVVNNRFRNLRLYVERKLKTRFFRST